MAIIFCSCVRVGLEFSHCCYVVGCWTCRSIWTTILKEILVSLSGRVWELGNHSLWENETIDYSSSSLVLTWDFKLISWTHKKFNDYPYMCRPHDEPVAVWWQLNYTNPQKDFPLMSAIFKSVIIQDTKYDYFDTINQHFKEEIYDNT